MAKVHSILSDETDQDDSITATHLSIIIKSLLKKGLIYPFLTTMWDHTDGFANQYRFVFDIYLLSCLVL